MARGGHGLVLRPQLLVELLPGPRSHELDFDVRHRLLAGEADHRVREIHDLHRLAHVEHVDLAAAADRAGLDDQLDRLGDRHEVARHLRMGHRDRATARDLLPEDRDQASRRAEHVPEADPAKARAGVHLVPPGLDDPLAERLRLAHHAARIHCLVRRHEDEALRPELDGDIRDGARHQRVVADGLHRVRLDEGHVLVRGGMEDDGRAVLLEDLSHLGRIAGVGEHRRRRVEAALVDELALDLEEPRLRVVDEDEPRGADAGDLATELGADRAAGARHEDDLTREVARRSSRCPRRRARGRAGPRPAPGGSARQG